MTRLRTRATKPPGVSRHAALLPVLALLLMAALTACGSASADDGGVATLSDGETADTTSEEEVPTDPQERALAFAECMRENGVPDFPDPEFDEEGNPQFKIERRGAAPAPTGSPGDGPAVEGPDPAMQQAFEACEHLNPRPELSVEEQQEMQDQALAFAQCMRDHGIDFPDPKFTDDGGMLQQFGEGQINPDDPNFQQAQEACGEELGGDGPRFGGGPDGEEGDDA